MNVFANEISATQQVSVSADRFMYFNIDEKRAGRAVADYRIQQIKDFDGGSVFYVQVGTHDATLLAALGKTVYSPWLAYDMLILGDDAERIGAITTEVVDASKPMIGGPTWRTVEDIASAPSQDIQDDFTADEWAALGEEVGSAKRGLLASARPTATATSVVAHSVDSEPLIRLGALSIRGNPMRPRRRAA